MSRGSLQEHAVRKFGCFSNYTLLYVQEYAQFHSEATLAREKLESKLQTYEDELEDLRDYKDDLLEELQQWKKKYGLGEKTSREIVDYVEEDDVYTWYSVLCEEIQRITQLFHMNLKRKSAKMQLTHRRNDVVRVLFSCFCFHLWSRDLLDCFLRYSH